MPVRIFNTHAHHARCRLLDLPRIKSGYAAYDLGETKSELTGTGLPRMDSARYGGVVHWALAT